MTATRRRVCGLWVTRSHPHCGYRAETASRWRCTGCGEREDLAPGRAPSSLDDDAIDRWAPPRFVVVASVLPLSGAYCRGCLSKRDAVLGQVVEAVQ